MEFITGTLIPFIIVISVIVFVHEWGHFIVARLCGVRVETFSIGFGKELFGWNDRHGTRWRVSLLPLGGYVKMFGDADPASTADENALQEMTEEEKKSAFHYKPLWQKASVVFAGPAINFIFAIIVFVGFFMFIGYPQTPPVAGDVLEGSAAAEAGMEPGDRILEIDGEEIHYFADISRLVSLNPEHELKFTILRNGEPLEKVIVPTLEETTDAFGNTVKVGRLGISTADLIYEPVGPGDALVFAVRDTFKIVQSTLTAVGQMIAGDRGTEELGGVLRIAKYSGQSAERGIEGMLWFMAMLSVNLGLINLFPIPLLDGGHLFYYLIEAVTRRPVNQQIQEYGFKLGFSIIILLMLFTTVNDIIHIWF